jgi:hypothetical protein
MVDKNISLSQNEIVCRLYLLNMDLCIFQGSKRTLRSNEMPLPANGLLDTELELNFALQVSSCIGFFWLAQCSSC